MALPKSVTRVTKDGVEFTSSVDKVNYTMNELIRAALRDVGKYLVIEINKKAQKLPGMSKSKRVRGTRKAFQFWVRSKQPQPNLQVGVKHDTWYGAAQELGDSKMPRKAFMRETAEHNIATIVQIESQYLSYLEDEAKALAEIDEKEYTGEDVDE